MKFWAVTKTGTNTAEVLLYGYIFDDNVSDFIRELRYLDTQYTNINVRINSAGGDVYDGFVIYNAIRGCKATVDTYVDGVAASMGSIVALAGNKRYISKYGRIMTHKPSAFGGGNSESLRQNADTLDQIETLMAGIYAGATGLTIEQCRTKFMNGQDNWFSPEEAKAIGLVHEVFDAMPVAAPEQSTDLKAVWSNYNELQFAAVFQTAINQTSNMNFQFTAATLAHLGLQSMPTDTASLEAAIQKLATKASQADSYKTQYEAASQKLSEQLAAHNSATIKALLDKAVESGKIKQAVVAQLSTDYAENPEGLKNLLDVMVPYTPVEKRINQDDSAGDDAEKLVAEWNKLDKNGGLQKLKETNFPHYSKLHLAKWGKEPQK